MSKQKLSNRICPDGMSLEEWQVALRQETAKESNFIIRHLDDNTLLGDYMVTHDENNYRVAFRGVQSDKNFCSCLDFRTSALGTCKHIEAVVYKLKNEVAGYPWENITYTPPYSSIYVSYKGKRSARISIGTENQKEYYRLKNKYFGHDNILRTEFYEKLEEICEEALAISEDFRCYEDVYDFINSEIAATKWAKYIEAKYPNETLDNGYAVKSKSNRVCMDLYKMLHTGYGILIGELNVTLRKEVLALMDATYQYEAGNILIITSSAHSSEVWRDLLLTSSFANNRDVIIISKEHFNQSYDLPNGSYAFLFMEDADCLKDWNDLISKTLKKLTIKHLYMHLYTVTKLTPVQFSSIIQHISPFILAPFYRFIRDYRPAFPLSDMGDGLPEEAKHFVFTRIHTKQYVWPDDKVDTIISEAAMDKVDLLLRLGLEVLNDDILRRKLILRLERLYRKDD